MSGENNPFQPALTKPVDESVLHNDPEPDNFGLSGISGLGDHQKHQRSTVEELGHRPTMDSVMAARAASIGQTSSTMRIDQMFGSAKKQPAAPQKSTVAAGQIGSVNFGTLGSDADKAQSVTNTGVAESDIPGIDINKLLNDKTSVGPVSMSGPQANFQRASAVVPKADKVAMEQANKAKESTKPAKKGGLFSGFGAKKKTAKPEAAKAADVNDPLKPLSPIAPGEHAAAEAAKPNAAAKPAKKNASQGKEVTISTMTVVFAVLFVIATGVAIYFGVQNSKNANALADSQARLSQMTDSDNDAKSSTNKSTTQLSALQDKVQDLTKQTEDNQKTIDDLNKKNNDLTKQNGDLQTQLKAANDKMASDKAVSDNMNSLLNAVCTEAPYNTSSACVSHVNAGGGNNNPGASGASQSSNTSNSGNNGSTSSTGSTSSGMTKARR